MAMKKRNNTHHTGASSASIPIYQKHQHKHHDGNVDHPRSKPKTRKGIMLLVTIIIGMKLLFRPIFSVSDISKYGPPINSNNTFVSKFENTLINDLGHDFFVPLMFENGKLLCRRKHKQQLSRYRIRFFTQMVRLGLQREDYTSIDVEGGLPILVMEADGNGCNIRFQRDEYGYPRLAWSTMASAKFGNHCQAVGMPSYETWAFYHRSHKLEEHWEQAFHQDEKEYPWAKKLDKAVWRGSTTYEGSQYSESLLGETPRGKLVKKSMEHPDLIDAGFHKIIQKFQAQRHELAKQFTLAERISSSDMMQYKAIIDIDGNNWSSRFGVLLCSNSVVIKIDPDFTEYFYDDGGDVRPMEHYVPASLENITDVVSYVIDSKNEEQMKTIVKSANSWCKKALSEDSMARASIAQLDAYRRALDSSGGSWSTEWQHVKQQFTDTIGDFVDCNAWSVIDWFFFPELRNLF